MKNWSERNGRTDITVRGFTLIDNLCAIAAGLIVVCASVLVLGALS